MATRFESWSPSRFFDYEACPFLARLKHLDKLCPLCFKGKVRGGYDKPAICDRCGCEVKPGPALVRGDEIGKAHDLFIEGKARKMHPEVTHPKVVALTKEARALYQKAKARIQLEVNVDHNWKLVKTKGYDPSVWGRFRLDLFIFITAKEGRVRDWKTGGLDKRTGAVRVSSKYDDQLFGYAVASLILFPQVDYVTSDLTFLDCGERFDPVVERKSGTLDRAGLPKAQKEWERKLKPMFSDTKFSPKPCDQCGYCPFRKEKGGPCKF